MKAADFLDSANDGGLGDANSFLDEGKPKGILDKIKSGLTVGDGERSDTWAGASAADAASQSIAGSDAALGIGFGRALASTGKALQAPIEFVKESLAGGLVAISDKDSEWYGARQKIAQDASAAAEAARGLNLQNGNAFAEAGVAAQKFGREHADEQQKRMAEFAPMWDQQSKNIDEAKGFVDKSKAFIDNPIGGLNTVLQSAPDTLVGMGVGKAVSLLGAGEKVVGGVALGTEAAQSGMSTREGVEHFVMKQPVESLAQNSERFRELSGSMSPEKARAALANELGAQSVLPSALGTAIGGKLVGEDIAIGKTIAGGNMTGREFLGRVGTEIGQEGLQNPAEAHATYRAQVQADPKQEFDLGGSIAEGVFAGGGMGAGMHSPGYISSKLSKSEGSTGAPATPPDPAPQLPDSGPLSRSANIALATGAATLTQAPAIDPTADPFERIAELELLAEQRPLTQSENAEANQLQAMIEQGDEEGGVNLLAPNPEDQSQEVATPIDPFMAERTDKQLKNLSSPGQYPATRNAAIAEIARRGTANGDGRQKAIDAASSSAADVLSKGGSEQDANRAATDSLIESMGSVPGISIANDAPAAVQAAKAIKPEAAPVKSEQPQPAKGAENAQAQAEVLTKPGAVKDAAPTEPTAEQKKAENKAKLDAVIAKRKAEKAAKDPLDRKSDKFWKGETWRDIAPQVIASKDVRVRKEPKFTGSTLGVAPTEFDYYLSDGRRSQKIDKEVAEYIESLKAVTQEPIDATVKPVTVNAELPPNFDPDVQYAKNPDGSYKTKGEYTPEEWAAYTKSAIDKKLSQSKTDAAPKTKPKSTTQQSVVKRDLTGLAARDDLVGAIMRVTGNKGIDSGTAQTITGDKAGSGNPKLRGLFLNGGTMDLGDIAELLRAQENFDVRDADHLSELIRSAAAGDVATSMARTEDDAAANEEEKRKDYYLKRASELGLKGIGGTRKLEKVIADVDAKEAEIAAKEKEISELEAREERAAIQTSVIAEEIYQEGAELTEADLMSWLGDRIEYSQDEINEANTRASERESRRAEANAYGDTESETQGSGTEGAGTGQAESRTRGAAEDFNLAGQTNAQAAAAERARVEAEAEQRRIDAQESADKKAAEKKSLEDAIKARAENPDNFQFGEDAKAAAKPMGGLFDQSAPKPEASTKEPWQITRDRAVWGEYAADGSSTDRALAGRLAKWEKIKRESGNISIDAVDKAIAIEKARIERANTHRAAVSAAISEGKQVPANVLADYPDLKPTKENETVTAEADNLPKNQPKLDTSPEPVQKAAENVQVESESNEPIADFGEKIAGAKKDEWKTYQKSMSDDLPADAKDVTLSKNFPEPNYEALIANGVDLRIVAAVKAMRDTIPAKPRMKYKLDRWVAQLKQLREFSADLISGKQDIDRLITEMRKLRSLSEIAERIDLYAELGYPAFKNADGYKVSGGWSGEFDPATQQPTKRNMYGVTDGRGRVTMYDNREQAIDSLRAKLQVEPEGSERSIKLDLYRVTTTGDIVIGKKVASNKFIDLKVGFKSVRDAREYLKENEAELLKLLEKKKQIAPTRRSTNDPRVGKDYRQGEDVTPEKFAAEFGFRGVQFGNYVEQARRVKDLNNAYDALLDLANTIGVPPRAISLNGSLGLAFGARGNGGVGAAAAHYEPGQVVINLTKIEGAGSLGHEFFHAMDNYFAKAGDRKESYLTVTPSYVDVTGVRPEVVAAFKALMKGIKASDYAKRGMQLDSRRRKDYWSNGEEMAARAFESYLIAKAEANGESNDYLANIVSDEAHTVYNEMLKDMGMDAEPYPYPTKEEQKVINPLFDALFNTLETKETDKGIAMFSRGNGEGMALRDLQAVVDRISKSLNNLPKVHVLASPSELSKKDPSHKSLRDYIRKAGAWEDAEGATHDGEIYLFASGLADEARAEHVLATHEVTHYGLRGAIGKDLDGALQEVWILNAKVRKAAAELKERYGLKSNIEATEEVLADMRPQDLIKLLGWRRVVKSIRDWLGRSGFNKLAAQFDSWLKSGLDDAQKADLMVADLVNAARDWVKNGKGRPFMDGTRLADGSLAEDVAAQEKWLTREAKGRGYKSIDDMAEKNRKAFENLAKLWREKHPVEGALLSRGLSGSVRGMADKDTVAGTQAPTSAGDGSMGSATIEVDGVLRSTLNSNGKPIAQTEDGIRDFWRWFSGSQIIDDKGRPIVFYHGTDVVFDKFSPDRKNRNVRKGSAEPFARKAFWLTDNEFVAKKYARYASLESRRNEVVKSMYVRSIDPRVVDMQSVSPMPGEYNSRIKTGRKPGDKDTDSVKEIGFRKERETKEAAKNNNDSVLFLNGYDGEPYSGKIIAVFDGENARNEPSASAGSDVRLSRRSQTANQTAAKSAEKEKLTAADKAIYGMAAEGKSAADILKFIASASRNPFNRQVAKLLLKTGITPSVTVGDAKGWKFNAGEGNKYAAAYNPKTDTVALFRPAAAERNMIHELIHAATLKALAKNGNHAANMRALYDFVKRAGKLKGMYGMADVDEFVAETFSNPKFQAALKGVEVPKLGNSPTKNAWAWFIRNIRSILGLEIDSHDALSQALDIGLGVMRENMRLSADPKNGNVRGMADKDTVAGTQAPTSAGDGPKGSEKYSGIEFTPAPKDRISSDRLRKINALGLRHAETGDYTSYYTPVFQIAYNLGQNGVDISNSPVIEGIRYGSAPEFGVSKNYLDDTSENGLSLAMVQGEREISSSIWFKDRKAFEYRGVLVGRGSDGEALILPLHVDNLDDSSPSDSIRNEPSASAGSDDIRYNIIDDAKANYDELTSPDAINTLIYNFQNKFIDLKNIKDRIVKMGGQITDLNDAYLGEETYHSKVMKRGKDFLEGEMKPLLQQLHNNQIKKEDFEQFLHARHAPERNAEMAKRNPNQAMIDAGKTQADADVKALELQLQTATAQGLATKAIDTALTKARAEKTKWHGAQAFQGTEEERNSLSGMSDAAAAQVIASIPAGRRSDMDSAAAKVDAINAKTLDTQLAAGLIDKATFDSIKKAYQYYVPLHRDEAHPDQNSHSVGQGFSVKGAGIKRATGSNEKVTNILGHIALQREAQNTRAEKNSVVKRLVLMAMQNPIKDFWTIDKPPMIKTIDQRTGFVRSSVDPMYKNKPNVVMARIAGKDIAIVFNERNPEAVRLAEALKNLDGQDLDVVERSIGRVTRWIASVNTQYNPIFGLINFSRDVQGAMFNLTTTELKDHKAATWKETFRLFKEIAKSGFQLDKMNAADQALWEDFQNNGGATGYRDLFANPEERTKALDKELKALDGGPVAKKFMAAAKWLSDYNESMENVVRLAAYKVSLQNGMSKERAASLAKNLTVNFNRKGAKAQKLGAFYAFFNASIQGSTRLAQTLKGPAGRKIIAGGIALGVMQQMLGMMMMGGGDDDEWEKVPDFIKERSIVIPTGKDTYVSIPMPLGFNVIPNVGRLFAEWAMGGSDKQTGKQLAKLAGVIVSGFNPVGGTDVVDAVTPTAADPMIALLRNKDWTGKPIYREDMASLDPTPGFTRTKDSATPWAKGMAYAVNWASGGTDYQPGAVSWTPDQIDYVIGTLTGGAGRELGKLAQTLAAPFSAEELPTHKIPLVGRVVGSTAGVSGQSEKFYENIRTLNGLEREIKGRARAGKDIGEFIDSEPRAELVGLANASETQVKKLRESQRFLKKEGDNAGAKEIDGMITEVMKGLNMEMRQASR